MSEINPKITNCIKFAFLMHSGGGLIDKSPDYILEKWQTFISPDIPEPSVNHELYEEYIKKWGSKINGEKLIDISGILEYLYVIRLFNKGYVIFDTSKPSDIIEKLPKNINSIEYNTRSSIHPILLTLINDYMKKNIRDITLLNILENL